jgi:hypothetical protein
MTKKRTRKSKSPNYEKIIKNLENKIREEKNKHEKKITSLVHEYIHRPQTMRRRWKNGKHEMMLSNGPVLVNVNEERNLKGLPSKRRPLPEKKSRILREIFKNEYPNEYNAYGPGRRHIRQMVYENSALPNPYVK